MIKAIARKILLADDSVSALVGTRVYITAAPQTAHLTTYILIQGLPAQSGTNTSSGQVTSTSGQFIVNCIANAEEDAYTLQDKVQTALRSARGTTVLSTLIQNIWIDSYDVEPIEQEGSELPKAYGYSVFVNYFI